MHFIMYQNALHLALDDSRKSIAVFLNFAKVFDTVDYEQILNSFPGF